MRITPLDVRKQEFRKVVRGLDPEEVYAFLATVADEYEAVLTDNKQLRDRVLELDEKVTEYRNMEKTLRDTLLTAERVMAEARENARKEAELILRDAKVQSQQESQNLTARTEALKAQLRDLRSQRDAFLARMRSLAESQIHMMDSYVEDFRQDDRQQDIQAPTPPAPKPEPPSGPAPDQEEDRWRSYRPGLDEGSAEAGEEGGPRASADEAGDEPPTGEADQLAATVAEMAEAAGGRPGHGQESVRPSADLGEAGDGDASAPSESAGDDTAPAAAPVHRSEAEAYSTEEREAGSRWSIARFTRGLGDI